MQTADWQLWFSDRFTGARNPARPSHHDSIPSNPLRPLSTSSLAPNYPNRSESAFSSKATLRLPLRYDSVAMWPGMAAIWPARAGAMFFGFSKHGIEEIADVIGSSVRLVEVLDVVEVNLAGLLGERLGAFDELGLRVK